MIGGNIAMIIVPSPAKTFSNSAIPSIQSPFFEGDTFHLISLHVDESIDSPERSSEKHYMYIKEVSS
jgi:hypothetical protein